MLRLYNSGQHTDVAHMEPRDCVDYVANSYMRGLLPFVFKLARLQERWGHALALLNQFGGNDCICSTHIPSDHQRVVVISEDVVCARSGCERKYCAIR